MNPCDHLRRSDSIRHIRLDEHRRTAALLNSGFDLLGSCGVARIVDGNLCALRREADCNGAPDAAGCARYEGDFPTKNHECPPS